MANIHPLATVHPNAKLGENVEVGPYAYIEEHVEIGDGSKILPHATIFNYVTSKWNKFFVNCIDNPRSLWEEEFVKFVWRSNPVTCANYYWRSI